MLLLDLGLYRWKHHFGAKVQAHSDKSETNASLLCKFASNYLPVEFELELAFYVLIVHVPEPECIDAVAASVRVL